MVEEPCNFNFSDMTESAIYCDNISQHFNVVLRASSAKARVCVRVFNVVFVNDAKHVYFLFVCF